MGREQDTVKCLSNAESQHAPCHLAIREMIAVLEPPPQYNHPYKGPVAEIVMSLAQARALCRKHGAIADACSWIKDGKCYIVMPRDGPVKALAPYRRHEVAHCNGWPAHHPRI
jgi:hypothetical protein